MISYLRQIFTFVKPYKTRLLLGVLCGVFGGLASPLLMITVKMVAEVVFPSAGDSGLAANMPKTPAWIQNLLSHITPHASPGEPISKTGKFLVISTIPMVMLLRGVFAYLNNYFMSWTSIRAVTDLRVKLFQHLLSLSLSFFHKRSTAELIARIDSASIIQNTISNSLTVIIREPIAIISLAALLLSQQPKLTLVSLLVLPLCILPVVFYGRRVRKSSAAFHAQSIGLMHLMYETFTANRIVKAYNLEGTVVDQCIKTARQFIGHYMRMVRATELPGPMIEFFGALGVGLLFLYIAFATTNRPTLGDFLQFVGSIFLMYAPIKQLTRLHNQIEQSRAVSEAVFKLLETTATVSDPPQPKPLQAAGADIHFEDIHFDYGEKIVLHGFNLTIKAGQLVALVGSSGSGKTTVTNLLLRFYDPQRGAVRIGKTDIRDVSQRDLRSQIAVVTQETVLFNDTIRRNIEMGRPGASNAEIEEAARHAYAYDFIMEKPQGFDTVVGEKGILISGGQRQRITIARAILRNAPILVLDEAMSALDSESERAVQAALDELMVGRTSLCIAHRLSTIQHADVIIVMSEGRIVEIGQHAELLKRGGHYRRLYELQFPG